MDPAFLVDNTKYIIKTLKLVNVNKAHIHTGLVGALNAVVHQSGGLEPEFADV